MSDARRPLGPDDVEALLKRVERPKAPEDMLAKVRARIAEQGAREGEVAPVISLAGKRPWTRFWVEGLTVAAAVAALVVAVQLGEQIPQGGNPAAEAAGIGGEDTTVVDARLVARGLDAALVQQLAESAGLSVSEGAGDSALESATFEGGAHDVRRFLVSLRVQAARAGVEVNGFVPEAGRLRITVQTR